MKPGDLVVSREILQITPSVAHVFCAEVLAPAEPGLGDGIMWIAKVGPIKIYVSDTKYCVWKTYEQVIAEAML